MSDFRGEFEGNDDDEFNFDNSDFDFPEDEAGGDTGGDFDFGEEPEGEFEFEEEPFGEEELPEIEEEEEREGGISRPFIIIAALMILLFVGGLVAIVIIASGPRPLTEFEQTSTAIAIINATTIAQGLATQTESAIVLAQTLTAQAASPTPTPTGTPTRPPTVTPTPPLDATQQAATQIVAQTQTAQAATLTAQASTPIVPTTSAEDVQLTATALAQLLLGQGGGPSPTAEVLTPGTPSVQPTRLPQTGFFDDLAASGSGGTTMLALMALALVGVIVVSRRLRAANNRP